MTPQQVPLDFGKPQRAGRRAGRSPVRGVVHQRLPVFRRHLSPGPGVRTGGTFLPTPALAASFSICFWVGMRQLAGRSVISRVEHIRNIGFEPSKVESPKK